jgi:hypothetical protein
MAEIRMRIRAESVEELRGVVGGIIDEIEQGRIGEGCSDYDFSVDGYLLGVEYDSDTLGEIGPCILVEYDLDYSGGNYSSTNSSKAFIPRSLLDELTPAGADPGDYVGEAFEQHTGFERVHIIRFDTDHDYDANGDEWEEQTGA